MLYTHRREPGVVMAKDKSKPGQADEGPLDASPSHLLHRVLQLALDIYAEETGAGAITQRQFAVLTAVSRNEGLTQTDLVKATGIDRSTLADMVARMIAKGLLERERSSLDARANTVRLTEQGRAELEGAKPKVEAADRRILALLPQGKRDSFLNVLRAMTRRAEAAQAKAEGLAEEAAEGGGERKKKKKPGKSKADRGSKPDKKKKKPKKAA
jgi:DNA-binding MarR family transcriptional regulator